MTAIQPEDNNNNNNNINMKKKPLPRLNERLELYRGENSINWKNRLRNEQQSQLDRTLKNEKTVDKKNEPNRIARASTFYVVRESGQWMAKDIAERW